jgi:hypothetical protein
MRESGLGVHQQLRLNNVDLCLHYRAARTLHM